MGFSPEVERALVERFAGDTVVQARAILQPDQPDRVLLAVLKLSRGDLGRLQHFSETAAADWRDVLYWAENPPERDGPTDDDELRQRLGLTPEADTENEFSCPRSNLIVSRRGFSVDVRARSAIQYEEAGNAMEIFAEWLVSPEPEIAVRRRDVRAWEGREAEGDLAERDRVRIVENVRRAFAFKGWTLLIGD